MEYVVDDPATLDRLAFATHPVRARPSALLRPGTPEEVSQVVRISARHGATLHPISRGQNIGYGSCVPPIDGAAILDLSRLNRIRHIDTSLGTLVVEPGVTFRDVYSFLARRGEGWTTSATGGPLGGSIVGNLVQRGLGSGDQIDLWRGMLGLDAVLSDGMFVSLGLQAWPGAAETGAVGNGPGPSLAGLFSQSNWGVVTACTVALIRVPKHARLILWRAQGGELNAVIEALRHLRQTCRNIDTLRSYNHNKVLAARRIKPSSDEPDGYLPAHVTDAAARTAGVAPWQGVVGVQAPTQSQLDDIANWVRAELTRTVRDIKTLDASAILSPSAPIDWNRVTDLDGAMGSIEWKSSHTGESSTIGNLWFAPTVPFLGENAVAAIELAEQVCATHRLEPVLELIGLDERAMVMTVALTWDRSVPGADERAIGCHAALTQAFASIGLYPYRTGVGAGAPLEPRSDLAELWRRLDACLNPRGTLARTRLLQAASDGFG